MALCLEMSWNRCGESRGIHFVRFLLSDYFAVLFFYKDVLNGCIKTGNGVSSCMTLVGHAFLSMHLLVLIMG